MKVENISLVDCCIDAKVTVGEMAKLFEKNQDWPGIIITSDDQLKGMISRHHFFEILGKPYGIEVFSRKTAYEFFEANRHLFVLLDGNTSIQDAVKTALNRERPLVFEPLVIKNNRDNYAMLNMHDLLLAQCDVLENLYDEFHLLSNIDPLTQLANRRGFFECAQSIFIRNKSDQNELTALMIDIDNFKKVNDHFGHFAGDQVLCAVANEIRRILRKSDLVGRYGGEEFIALLPDTGIADAFTIADRLRKSVEDNVVRIDDLQIQVTISVGICHIIEAGESLDKLLSQADQAMYWAKLAGRNQISIWSNKKQLPCADNQPAAIQVVEKKLEKAPQILENPPSELYDEVIKGWAKAIEMRDKEMAGHSLRVVNLSVELAEKCGISGEDLVNVRRGALLHDIGKIAIPDRILLKPGKLTDEEWQIMRRHPIYAYDFLSSISFLKDCLDIPLCHHEHWDGLGYPRGLKGVSIPLAARVFSIIDVWDALCSDRCYRPAWTIDDACQYIRSQSGTQFDPVIVNAFLELLEEKEILNQPKQFELQVVSIN